jgi:hypothetical protein
MAVWQIFLWYFSKIGNKVDTRNFCLLWDVLQPPFFTTITCAWILEYCWSNLRHIWESTLSKSDYLVGHRGWTWEWIFKDFFLHLSRWTCQTFCDRCVTLANWKIPPPAEIKWFGEKCGQFYLQQYLLSINDFIKVLLLKAIVKCTTMCVTLCIYVTVLTPDGWQIFLWYFSKIGNKVDTRNFCLLWDVLQPPFFTTITCAWILEYCWSNEMWSVLFATISVKY